MRIGQLAWVGLISLLVSSFAAPTILANGRLLSIGYSAKPEHLRLMLLVLGVIVAIIFALLITCWRHYQRKRLTVSLPRYYLVKDLLWALVPFVILVVLAFPATRFLWRQQQAQAVVNTSFQTNKTTLKTCRAPTTLMTLTHSNCE